MKKLLISILLLFIINCGSELDPVGQANEKKEKEEKAKTKGLLIALYCESSFGYYRYNFEVSNTSRRLSYSTCMGSASRAYSGMD